MPSRHTPAGAPETTAAGNSGNRATSQKTSNQTAAQIRSVPPAGSKKVASQVTVNQVQTSETSVAQPPSIAQGSSITGSNRPDTSGNFEYDRYRHSDDPATRPSRQLDEAPEDKPATIAVKAYDGSEILSAYSSFFLQSVAESEQEKYQVVETFTAYYAFFFGKRPPIYRYSGLLLNDYTHNWMNTFRFLYDNYFRGTAAAELGAQAVITYDKRAVSGFLLNLSIQQEAMSDKGVPFSFDLLVISHDLVGFSTDFDNFIKTQQERLRGLKEKAAADTAALNKNPDGLQAILKNQVLQGAKPTGSAKKKGEKKTETPPSQQAVTGKQGQVNNLVQKSLSDGVGTTTYGEVLSNNTSLRLVTE